MNQDPKSFEERKRDHIQHALDSRNQALGLSGLDTISLEHEALPEIDFDEVELHSTVLGQKARTPFFICGMTAGHQDARQINATLARAAQKQGWVMGLGSQRRDLEALTRSREVDRLQAEWSQLRENAPDAVLIGNIGITQLVAEPESALQALERLSHEIQLSGLAIHLNALQEVIQPEGTPTFKGGLNAIKIFAENFSKPILVKETGCGFSSRTLTRLMEIPFAALDVSGVGGTHWGRIEGRRAPENSVYQQSAEVFANWGISTVESVRSASLLKHDQEVWASGGIRSGLDAAKMLALGADAVGFAKPALEAALEGEDKLLQWMCIKEYELQVALFCTGSSRVEELRDKGCIIE